MRIIIAAAAYRDLEAIYDYIAVDSPPAAQRTVLFLLHALRPLENFSRLGRPGMIDGTRELVIDHRFIVVYRIQRELDLVEVIAIAHAARDRKA